uniref:Phlebovirus glycoprotein G2 fusion domain-containing protein n=1 Tax=Panagrolaimus sp. ES5 TaxID=591445 RepID=A0AC34GBF4_9BILA
MYFATDGHRTVVLDDIQHAAMKLIFCPTKEDAVHLNCTVMFDACSCQPAETRMNCACRDNEMLLDVFDHKSLPREHAVTLLMEAGGHLYYSLANSVTQLQVNVQQLKAVTQMDMNRCIVKDVSVEGCVNCLNGVSIKGICETDFGNALGHVNCENGWSFSIRCSKPATNFKAVVHGDQSEVKTLCSVQCPSNQETFVLEGRLAFVPPPQMRNNVAPIQEVVDIPGFWASSYEYLFNFIYSSYIKIATTAVVVLLIVLLIRCLF